jgi:acyl phosphate:glycerol-3-phosphate acyltransferase
MPWVLTLAASYLLGSIPFSYLVARLFGVHDVRRVGSGNVGATNVMRNAGAAAGVVALLLDAGKGAAATLVAQRLDPVGALPALAAAAAVVGHVFPVWLSFRGGKGVATGAGAFAPLGPWAGLSACLVFALVAGASRYVSLASIAGTLALPALLAAFGARGSVVLSAAAVATLVVARHRNNIERLRAGSERRLGQRPA